MDYTIRAKGSYNKTGRPAIYARGQNIEIAAQTDGTLFLYLNEPGNYDRRTAIFLNNTTLDVKTNQ